MIIGNRSICRNLRLSNRLCHSPALSDSSFQQVKNIENEAVEPSKAELFCAKKSLYSTKSFMELQLSEELQKGIYCLNYQTPSKVQEAVLTLMIGDPGRHLVVQSPSGTGKTAAFLLAALKRVNTMLNVTQVLILSSMPELTLQIADVAERMVKYSKITTRHVMIPQPSPLKEHLIIGTPEAVSGKNLESFPQSNRNSPSSTRSLPVRRDGTHSGACH